MIFHHFCFSIYLFILHFFYRSIIDLQCCVSFRCTVYFFRNESLGPGRIQVGGSHEHRAPRILLCILEAAGDNVLTRIVTSMLLVTAFQSHSHNILAVSSSPALLPLSWFIVIFHLDNSQVSQLVFLPLSFFSYPCRISGLVDEARMGGGGGVSSRSAFGPIH